MEKRKPLIAEFVQDNRFELNSYLVQLFNQIADYFPKHYTDAKIIDLRSRKK